MLTASEKSWLKRRSGLGFHPYCLLWCDVPYDSLECRVRLACHTCPLSPSRDDFRDAAEFEARVASWLATQAGTYATKGYCEDCPCRNPQGCRLSCAAMFLMTARLRVEEEMDAEI